MENLQNENKKEKVGADGLTKKERRAQKEKSTAQNTTSPDISDNKESSTKVMTEKEQRRLEWAKKLKEQNAKENEKNMSKAELKAKRREQQEAQRQKKSELVATKLSPAKESSTTKPELVQKQEISNKSPQKKFIPKKESRKVNDTHKVQLVQHLYNEKSLKVENKILAVHPEIHPVFIKLGVQYNKQIVLGSNARCLALLVALKYVIADLKSPPKQEFCRYLESVLQTSAAHLHSCRPLAVSMTNALRYFKLQLTQIDTNLKDTEKKIKLQEIIDTYIHDDIRKASDAISMKVREKISNGDVILTYGCSSLITKILLEAKNDGKKFKVIIVDGRPLLEGRELLRRLVVAGLDCSYVLINAISYVMNTVTKVILGAHAILTNGYVMSRIGTAQVAIVAREYNKPVLVCCETYKFSERVQTDSFVYNEIGDPDKLSVTHVNETPTSLSKWKDIQKLTPLNILYDVTPPDLVTAVVTEIAILPCTSVPVVLRINASETS
ncbi:translation initiation factor eIF-2B subunit delta [Diorhabda sublineata]|uniref:translation initiation factor eIF-2B subunit delta n=1 Tax=Diorhabda sublineata TaxID=1163346 RepID=UPI0024E0BB3E|nr:translation initiation factor eIF-2B subunit delta [Diorhabda sublineata]